MVSICFLFWGIIGFGFFFNLLPHFLKQFLEFTLASPCWIFRCFRPDQPTRIIYLHFCLLQILLFNTEILNTFRHFLVPRLYELYVWLFVAVQHFWVAEPFQVAFTLVHDYWKLVFGVHVKVTADFARSWLVQLWLVICHSLLYLII